ncbi:hypothetical protein LOZ65_005868 [Ophidiomyces ophidiicola]|nr:hypothetical protein LOZ65_005868 [Ophidiomyces ophidiicola]
MDSRDQVPNLASVLQTLSYFVPPQADQSFAPIHEPDGRPSPDDSYDPLNFSPLNLPGEADASAARLVKGHYDRFLPSIGPENVLPDPRTITAWPTALKYVMKAVSHNETLQSRIRRLIRSQHDHEKKWWEAREALISKQTSRADKKKKLDEVLRSVGGAITTGPEINTPEDDAAEIKTYDAKVYKAMSDMSRALDVELRDLGVPFFAIRNDIIDQNSAPDDSGVPENPSSAGADKNGSIYLSELQVLRQRMLDLLEDLCKE